MGNTRGVHVDSAAIREREDFDVVTASGTRITTSWGAFDCCDVLTATLTTVAVQCQVFE